ncbi:MAG: 2-phosphosulfolactate phosphatase [Chloroflexi bacterium]|nr:2-phosphosulfolactate phosphatase [Chloroflexota bacterium]
MKFHYTDIETCSEATGLVIVIDVIRAFSNAAYVFNGGIEKIYPVSTIEEALAIKQKKPEILACGEVGGIPPEGFDFGNSPTQTLELDLHGRTLVQRTGAGTQGIVRSVNAEKMAAASLVVAGATVKYVQMHQPEEITFVVTGKTFKGGGEEDLACAEYLEALFLDKALDPEPFIERVRGSRDAKLHLDPAMPEFPETDLAYCVDVDRFNFAMPVTKENGRFVIRAVTP